MQLLFETFTGSYWVEISPRDYLVKATTDPTDTDTCFLGFTESDLDFFVLGDPLMRGYYVIFDDENSSVGIAPHASSVKKELTEYSGTPDFFLDSTGVFGLTLPEATELLSGLFGFAVLLYLVGNWLGVWERDHFNIDNNHDESAQLFLAKFMEGYEGTYINLTV